MGREAGAEEAPGKLFRLEEELQGRVGDSLSGLIVQGGTYEAFVVRYRDSPVAKRSFHAFEGRVKDEVIHHYANSSTAMQFS